MICLDKVIAIYQ